MYVPTIKDKSRLLFRLSHLFIWSIIGILVGTREPFQDAAYSNIIAPRSFYTNVSKIICVVIFFHLFQYA